MQSDAFRPRNPSENPQTLAMSQPWHIPPSLPHSAAQVILILGEPSHSDLFPLLTSPHLARSLVLIATHSPPRLPALSPSSPGPSVRILRLPNPLSAHENGALRVVNIFERAQKVARLWRYASIYPPTSALVRIQNRVMQLTEELPGGEYTCVEPVNYASPPELHPDNGSNKPLVSQYQPSRSSPAPSLTSRTSSIGKSPQLPSSPSLTRSQIDFLYAQSKLFKEAMTDMLNGDLPLPSSSSSPSSSTDIEALAETRTFDAILNFLPSGLSEKALLKQAILVSTLCAQYLAPPVNSGNTFSLGVPPPSGALRTRSVLQKPTLSRRPTSSNGSTIDPTANHGGTNPYARSYTSSAPQPFPPTSYVHSTQGNIQRFSTVSFASDVSGTSATSVPHFSTSTARTNGRRSSFSGLKRRLSALFGSSSAGVTKDSNPRDSVVSLPTSHPHQKNHGDPTTPANARRQQLMPRRGSSRNINVNTRSRTKTAHLIHVLPYSMTVNQIGNGSGNPLSSGFSILSSNETIPTNQRLVPAPISQVLSTAGPTTRNYSRPTAYSPYAGLQGQGEFDNRSMLSSNQGQLLSTVHFPHTRTLSGLSGMSGVSGVSSMSGFSGTSSTFATSAAKPKFVQNLEQFLTNFAGPSAIGLTTVVESGQSSLAKSEVSDNFKPVAYIVSATLFGRRIPGTKGSFLSISSATSTSSQNRELTVGEVILLGALDMEMAGSSGEPMSGRCWVRGLEDLIVLGPANSSSARPPLNSNSFEPAVPDRLFIERTSRTPPPPLIKVWEEEQRNAEEEDRIRAEILAQDALEEEERRKAGADQKMREAEQAKELQTRLAFESARKEAENREREKELELRETQRVHEVEEKVASRTLPTPPESSSSGEEIEVELDRGRSVKKSLMSRVKTRSKSRSKPSSKPKSATESTSHSSSSSIVPLPPSMNIVPITVPPIVHVEARSPLSIQAEYKASNHQPAHTVTTANDSSVNNGKQPHYVRRATSSATVNNSGSSQPKMTSKSRPTTPKKVVKEGSSYSELPNPQESFDADALWNAPIPQRVKPIEQAKVYAGKTTLSPQQLYVVPEHLHSTDYASGLHRYPSANATGAGYAPQSSRLRASSTASSVDTLPKRRPGMRSVDSSGTVSVSGTIRASSPLARSTPLSPTRLTSVPGQGMRHSDSGYHSASSPMERTNSLASSAIAYNRPLSPASSFADTGLPKQLHPVKGPHMSDLEDSQSLGDADSTQVDLFNFLRSSAKETNGRENREQWSKTMYYHTEQNERPKTGFTGTLRKMGLWKREKSS
ncbi:hypothetical protein CPB83DRAFT_883342 [Crepidotus variabilis]|uniref:Uncharacterized protein n=1 Tax=Crepidotus variabilis TaxID=179855 RepID=A0A9P6JQ85_9AGAR|nr:hypothetical protein CPB83DRAFT_883342 [Crepidotus variabilis]